MAFDDIQPSSIRHERLRDAAAGKVAAAQTAAATAVSKAPVPNPARALRQATADVGVSWAGAMIRLIVGPTAARTLAHLRGEFWIGDIISGPTSEFGPSGKARVTGVTDDGRVASFEPIPGNRQERRRDAARRRNT